MLTSVASRATEGRSKRQCQCQRCSIADCTHPSMLPGELLSLSASMQRFPFQSRRKRKRKNLPTP